MKKGFRYIMAFCLMTSLSVLQGCKDDFLDKPVQGALGDEVLSNEKGIDGLLTGAYAALDGQGDFNGGSGWEAPPDNWVYGSIPGGDAHKGSDGGDQTPINAIATFASGADNGFFNTKWRALYEGVSRANAVLKVLALVTDISPESKANIEGQALFLRAHYYFEAKKMWNMVPWIDETTTDFNQPNDKDIWPMIEADFKAAYEKLPATQTLVGRANKWAAGAYLAKTYLYQRKFAEAATLFATVISSGVTSNGLKYDLVSFKDNFDAATKNNAESVFAIQMVANDGTLDITNANMGSMLNFPYGTGAPFSCCGFFQPSQMLVNSYRTDANGLPYMDDFNSHAVKNDLGIASSAAFVTDAGPLDPRLDWTVGRRDVPYHDWGLFPGMNWVRDQRYGGPYAPKKNIHRQKTQDLYADLTSWAPGNAINVLVIRFADVLLMAAEAEANAGSLAKAEEYVNRVRTRAADKTGWLYKYIDNKNPLAGFSTTPAANYVVKPYPAGSLAAKGKDNVLKAIYFERGIELAMEGHRFFDLVRWGQADKTLNSFFSYESKITSDLAGGKFINGKNNYFPIPQYQIDMSVVNGAAMLKQNPGYN
ncbi:RagB/SusD family nutrient uptake outer membrane protein [Dyadobacter chenwenxiniae]|uniref:RagB/SusD family nutrient uptake outer membrane protein n=1 Tax=Dyadobacter chenwenxiniae TaxID=2906456 RepID=A0A9X1TMW4_9BACT|nr:RagB/SusD family nutrient uptake outer membrane protein [Dyadobacter chenwenxiniae]MCF0064003.1 RagB/SusD family nutrient uptake outer membrane protein [Dyadobacter chenwenxiniae]UON82730.1 RagB/SusD family nutrient uptake outer membrane protein [Dyadobacter chenwenxiniae]